MTLNETRLPGNMHWESCQTHIFQLDSMIDVLGFPLKDDLPDLHVH